MPLSERPRERLIKYGVESLSTSELLAIIFKTGDKNISAIDLSNNLINDYGIEKLKNMSYSSLSKIKGIKESKACTLLACFELVKRCYSSNIVDVILSKPQNIYDYIFSYVALEDVEVLYAIYVNVKCQLIEKVLISKGRAYTVQFDVKKILSLAIENECYGIILVHNHPSGDINPSKSDIDSTYDVKKALRLLDIVLIDHIIVSRKGFFSFAEMNYL